jgi:DNA (cytosine-5)-methyltransferase 1
MTSLRVGSLFAGCGGLDLGFRNAGYSLQWANELEPYFAKSYEQLCDHECQVGDFWHIAENMPEVDVIIGGPPCQSFSLVGKRIIDDPRGKLVGGFLELIRSKKPRAFLMENVAGLSASKIEGQSLPDFLFKEFSDLGYDVLIERVDATKYFVPQKRKRIIIMGVKSPVSPLKLLTRNEFADCIFDRTGVLFEDKDTSCADAIGDLPHPIATKGASLNYRTNASSAFAKLMRMESEKQVSFQSMPTMSEKDRDFVRHIPPGGNYLDIPDEISTTRIMKFKQSGGRTTTYGRLHPERPAYTINTYFNRPNVGANYHYEQERLITVREAMRLQSFPDTFSPAFKTQRELHTQIGNAVPPLMAEALALALKRSIG